MESTHKLQAAVAQAPDQERPEAELLPPHYLPGWKELRRSETLSNVSKLRCLVEALTSSLAFVGSRSCVGFGYARLDAFATLAQLENVHVPAVEALESLLGESGPSSELGSRVRLLRPNGFRTGRFSERSAVHVLLRIAQGVVSVACETAQGHCRPALSDWGSYKCLWVVDWIKPGIEQAYVEVNEHTERCLESVQLKSVLNACHWELEKLDAEDEEAEPKDFVATETQSLPAQGSEPRQTQRTSLTVSEISKKTGASRSTAYEWIRRKGGPRLEKAEDGQPGPARYTEESVEQCRRTWRRREARRPESLLPPPVG